MKDEFGKMQTEMFVAWLWHYAEEIQKTSLKLSDNLDETETRLVSTQVENLTLHQIIQYKHSVHKEVIWMWLKQSTLTDSENKKHKNVKY